jgi:FkbM family methyltransferase
MKAILDLGRFFTNHPLTRIAPLKPWGRFVAWQIKSRLQGEVIVPWIAGQRLAVRRGMTGATGNIYVGLHEFVDMMLPIHFLRAGDLFLDIGANIGSYTILASGVCGATTWAFEPDPDSARSLSRNIGINRLSRLVKVYQVALGAVEGEVPFTVGRDTTNKIAAAGDKNARIVRQVTLDSLTEDAEPVMMKMDVEGYEEQVIQGARRLLAKKSLKLIELETVTPNIEQLLSSNKFEKAYYQPFDRSLQRGPIGSIASSNYLFVREWDVVSARLATARAIKIFDHTI